MRLELLLLAIVSYPLCTWKNAHTKMDNGYGQMLRIGSDKINEKNAWQLEVLLTLPSCVLGNQMVSLRYKAMCLATRRLASPSKLYAKQVKG